MTNDDQRWMDRQGQLLRPIAGWCSGRTPVRLHVYAGLMRAHRWLWVRGLEV